MCMRNLKYASLAVSNIYIPQGVEARPVANEIAVIIKWSGIVKNSIGNGWHKHSN